MTQSGGSSWELEKESFHSPPESGKQEEAVGGSTSLELVQKTQPSTRVSLLVEALIKSMVAAYETDDRKATLVYHKICKRLFRMGLIDGSWSMTELEGARSQFERGIMQLLGVGPTRSPSLRSLWSEDDSVSQYKREFEEITQIGSGAFGKVFKVKHKLDGTEYAVKKIPIHSESLNSVKSYLSEVKTNATMNHPNVVQYKAAWLEIGSLHDFLPFTESSHPKITPEQSGSIIFHKGISFSCNNIDSDTNFEIVFEGTRNSKTNSSNTSFKEAIESSKVANAVVLKAQIPPRPQVRWATLYIQMALCHGTLHQWLRRHIETFNPEIALISHVAQSFKTQAIKEILIQILKGLAYIQSRGIVHHDIKPSNIFVSSNGGSLLVQLGDFGLACPLQRARHCLARGTPLYAAPEQLAGRCDPKSDIYSVGIVLFELLEDFSTDMERTKRISELRGRTAPPIPRNLELNSLVTALVRRLPEERPDALTLLRSLEGTMDASVSASKVEALQAQLSEKDREIQRLTDLLRKHGIQEI